MAVTESAAPTVRGCAPEDSGGSPGRGGLGPLVGSRARKFRGCGRYPLAPEGVAELGSRSSAIFGAPGRHPRTRAPENAGSWRKSNLPRVSQNSGADRARYWSPRGQSWSIFTAGHWIWTTTPELSRGRPGERPKPRSLSGRNTPDRTLSVVPVSGLCTGRPPDPPCTTVASIVVRHTSSAIHGLGPANLPRTFAAPSPRLNIRHDVCRTAVRLRAALRPDRTGPRRYPHSGTHTRVDRQRSARVVLNIR
jgi:hypothetical protein